MGCVAESIRFLTTYACLTANQGVANFILAWSHSFVENDHETISEVILLHSADSFQKGCCQLQVKVCAQSTGYSYHFFKLGVGRRTQLPKMTKAVDWEVKKITKPKTLRNGEITLLFTDIDKSGPSRKFSTLNSYLLMIFTNLKNFTIISVFTIMYMFY